MKENYFLTLWNFTYLKDTFFGKKSCNFEHGLETKNEFEKWPLITLFQCMYAKFHIIKWAQKWPADTQSSTTVGPKVAR